MPSSSKDYYAANKQRINERRRELYLSNKKTVNERRRQRYAERVYEKKVREADSKGTLQRIYCGAESVMDVVDELLEIISMEEKDWASQFGNQHELDTAPQCSSYTGTHLHQACPPLPHSPNLSCQ